MQIHFFITTKPEIFPDFVVNPEIFFIKKWYFKFICIFYPSGEPILLGGVGWRLRCNPFAVFKYSFMGHFLASFSARVGWRVLTRE